ncbi:fibronectin type III domain-containing protein [uncultured Chryseobacterium sp.]|uniref:fibronectin type III domain-containing protein n=1 Tax=uncultured Chryseobacterium sp. TaxID=259322 RepID=UPI0025F66B5A|nr:fibronectin type III domain-containing protein [uncultured Chryseobacterium sp.]
MKNNYIGLLRRKEPTGNSFKTKWLTRTFAAAALLWGSASYAQTNVASYAFSKSTGATYTPITTGTKLFPSGTNTSYDNEVSAAIPLSSPFTFGGTAVTSVYVSANGYITFGAAPSGTNYTPLSTLGSTTGAISAFGQDAGSSTATGAAPEISYLDSPTEFIVQYKDHANYYNKSTERLNFQIRLTYATGAINIVYGTSTDPGTATSGINPQVGIRGNSVTYATNVSPLMIGNVPAGTTCDWSKAVTGNAETSTMLFSSTTNVNVKIPTGLQYTWTPGTQLPVRTFAATTAVTNAGATLSWTAPTGATAYNVQYRALGSCDWTNFSGNPVSATTASLSGLTQNTTYQVQVQALNGTSQSMYSHIPNLAGTGSGYATAGSFTTLANCASTVTGLASSAITPDTATISWTASTTAPGNGYEYYYSTSSTAPSSTTTPSGSVGAGVTTANLSGLVPSTLYYYWVRGNCNGTDKGVWSSSANFTTLSLCPTVTAPTANQTDVTTTPTITWTAIAGATGYKVIIGTTSGSNNIADANVTTGTSYSVSSALNNSTQYYYSVTAYTANTSAPATPCTVRSFVTTCTPVSTLPLVENFDSTATGSSTNTNAPVCWRYLEPASWSGYGYVSSTYYTSAPRGYYIYNSDATTAGGMLVSPQITILSNGNNRVRFMAMGGSSGYTVQVGTLSNPADASTFTQISSVTLTGAMAQYTVNIPNGSNQYLAFRHGVGGTYRSIYLDDINIQAIPTCLEPTAITASNITTTTADVAWTAPSTVPANGYEIYYSTTNTAPGTTTPASTTSTTTSKSLSQLSPSTTYYVWVRSACSANDKSEWSLSASFTTLCVGVTNLSENFDSTSSSGSILPNCWSKLVTGTSSNAYVQASTVMSAPNNLYIYGNSATEPVIVKLPSITNLDTGNYAIKFKGRANYTAGGKIDVGYMTDPTNASTFVTLGTYTSTSNTTVDNYYLAITGVPAGVTTLALRNAGAPAYSVLIDDVIYNLASVLSTNNIASPVKENIKVYPNPFSDILNISDISNVKNVLVTDAAGRLVKTITNPSTQLHLGELKQGMYLVVLEMKDGSRQMIKTIKK